MLEPHLTTSQSVVDIFGTFLRLSREIMDSRCPSTSDHFVDETRCPFQRYRGAQYITEAAISL
jgi:hypothetical protein